MSFEETMQGFRNLDIYPPQTEDSRNRLRQWCSSVLLKPLLNKIENSHIQLMEKTSKLGVTFTVSPVGTLVPQNRICTTIWDQTKGWQPTYTFDEEGLLRKLLDSFIATVNASMCYTKCRRHQTAPREQQTERKQKLAELQQLAEQRQATRIVHVREGIDAISEYLKLQSLMRGEWAKGLLPCSSFPIDYTVQRIRELAEGTCVEAYEYNGREDTREENKKWSMEPPTDPHLLLYLFCAFLEHPNWMLHLDPNSRSGRTHARENPLFLGVLPPEETVPEKYIAVVSGVPSTLHPGACVLAVDKQSPTRFALYWDNKLQFTLQESTAVWDSMLLMCHIIKVRYGGVVRGVNMNSLNIPQFVDD